MEVLPVLDIQGGIVVHGIAGQRERYRAVRSVLTDATDPVDVATAIREKLGLERLYVADLDALEGRAPPAFDLYRELACRGHRLIVDAGVRDASLAREVARSGVADVIVALETLEEVEQLRRLREESGFGNIVFSIDLRDGKPLGGPPAWRHLDALAIAGEVLDIGFRRLIVLDLAAVGMAGGCPLLDLVDTLSRDSRRPEVITGGGVRTVDDLVGLRHAGSTAVLVASALHSGAISADELRPFRDNKESARATPSRNPW